MIEQKQKYTPVCGAYRYNEAGELYFVETKQGQGGTAYEAETAIANHTPLLKTRRIVDTGLEQTEELVFNAYRAGRRGLDTVVTKKDLRGGTPDMAFPADCYIYPGRGNISRYRECLHIQCADRQPVTLYRHTGYAVIDGKRVFLNGGHKVRPQLNYIIELDRRGYNDAVFYQRENEAFERYICGFGFEKQYGTCSDISYIAPHLGVAAVNISSGYYCEHQRHEYIRIDQMEKTAERVAAMVQMPSEAFAYMERTYMMPLRRQSARYDLSGGTWDSMAAGMNGDRCLAMALPTDACVKIHGFTVCEGEYLLDGKENLLRYIPELDAAVCVEQGQAYDVQGNRLRFELDDLRRVRVIPVAEALELLQAVY